MKRPKTAKKPAKNGSEKDTGLQVLFPGLGVIAVDLVHHSNVGEDACAAGCVCTIRYTRMV